MKELIEKGIKVLGNKENFMNWIEIENEALRGVTPDSLLDSSLGISIVYDLLLKIEKGIVS